MSFQIDRFKLLREHANSKRELHNFTAEELGKFPLEYLLTNTHSLELLYAWHKLPSEFVHEFLQMRLPCFVHYNPYRVTDFIDAPPPSQYKCQSCKIALKSHSLPSYLPN